MLKEFGCGGVGFLGQLEFAVSKARCAGRLWRIDKSKIARCTSENPILSLIQDQKIKELSIGALLRLGMWDEVTAGDVSVGGRAARMN